MHNNGIKDLSSPKSTKLLRLTKKKHKRPFPLDVLFHALKLLVLAVFVVGFLGLGLVYGVAKAYIDTTPVMDVAQLTISDRTSYLYDRNGEEIMSMASIEYRDWVNIEEIPEMLRNAFISVEDVRFYKHSGVDFKRLFSAALEVLGNSNSSGGSTITQQLIKNKILGSERTYKRKIQEAFLALQLETVMEKDDILEAYLNDIYLGGSNYGVKAAAHDFFGKDLSELTIRECAMIAGLTQNPYRYNPRLNYYWEKYDRAEDAYEKYTVARTNTVLRRMYENDKITLEQYRSAMAEDVKIVETSVNSKMYDMAYFVEYCVDDVITHWLKADGVADTGANRVAYENKLRTGGYRIYTTVDPSVQNTVQSSLSNWENYPKLADMSQNVITETISDTITIETIEPQAAAVVIDQSTGELRAIVGGRTEPSIRKGINRAASSYTEVGSSIKPLSIYGTALDNGVSPASIVPNVDGEIPGWGGDKGYPSGGLSSSKRYGPVTVRTGLEQSLNVVAARLLLSDKVGITRAVQYLERLGIPASQINQDGPGLALGTSGITPIQMCAAYAAIANNGYYLEPLSFTKVTDSEGNVILDADIIRGTQKRVYNEASTAYFLVDLLKQAVASGTGKKAQIDGYEVAGKTGTNSDYASVYFAGMTCDYTAVVWVGHDYPNNKLETGSQGSDYAAPLWQDFMQKIMEGHESRPINRETTESLGLVRRTVCPVSGLLATEACIHYHNANGSKFNLVTDWFDYSDVPTEYCDMHVTLSICNVSGKLAGENCSSDTIEEKTYVLIRPNSPFYSLRDSVLNKVFGETWVRTDQSIAAYRASLPVCSQETSMDSLRSKVAALTDACTALLQEETLAIEEGEREQMLSFLDQIADVSEYERLNELYESLHTLYQTVYTRTHS
ncbi:MAG: transglycosylase domain-containing protein [Clostridia bacterium]|nr:transglycosylase domain-containing protein [Clostridia bacterium]